jgi:hypothetical protein
MRECTGEWRRLIITTAVGTCLYCSQCECGGKLVSVTLSLVICVRIVVNSGCGIGVAS